MRRACFVMTLFGLVIIGPVIAHYLYAEQFQYDSHGKRDPMIPLIGQEKPGGMPLFSEIASIDDVKLAGVTASRTGINMAIINGELVKEGFKAGEVEVKKIAKNSVILIISGKEYTIPLPEEGGRKN